MEIALRCGLRWSVHTAQPGPVFGSKDTVIKTVYPLLQPNDMNTIFRPFHWNWDLPQHVRIFHFKYSESELTVYHGVDTKTNWNPTTHLPRRCHAGRWEDEL
jgi:hypothetical protein